MCVCARARRARVRARVSDVRACVRACVRVRVCHSVCVHVCAPVCTRACHGGVCVPACARARVCVVTVCAREDFVRVNTYAQQHAYNNAARGRRIAHILG